MKSDFVYLEGMMCYMVSLQMGLYSGGKWWGQVLSWVFVIMAMMKFWYSHRLTNRGE